MQRLVLWCTIYVREPEGTRQNKVSWRAIRSGTKGLEKTDSSRSVHCAAFVGDETGDAPKFRPYGVERRRWIFPQVSRRVTVRLNTSRSALEFRSTQK